ncbi:hypothetical protein [Arthrobacter sp. Br18]|uniref:hypothetical protein n=1 Tax=Arthrobacter sp. Br18 TaxID=1312954 RepID=UPI001C1E6E1A|nr:hypothetical protein [Arthrobacter sp. Br18]
MSPIASCSENSKHMRYSDNALKAMKEAKAQVDMDHVWAAHRTLARNKGDQSRPACDQPGCVAKLDVP